jgi:hypothetical protein
MYLRTIKFLRQSVILSLIAGLLFITLSAQQTATDTIRGKITDAQGALVSGANITVVSQAGIEKTTQTNREGIFSIGNLPAGKYSVKATAPGFTTYENNEVELETGKILNLDISLAITVTENVTIGGEQPINTNPETNASAIVLSEDDFKALPDDPAELEAALQAMAGPGAGPNGGEIIIDGFSGGKVPRSDSIREIRVNQNPFSAEYDRLGLGRIEILTKPGADKWRGEIGSEFEDESVNSRNPFATNRPPFQLRNINGNIGGPLIQKRASFFVDVEKEDIDNNALVNALVLDSNLNPTAFQRSFLAPLKTFEINPRVDFQINQYNTLTARYSYESSNTTNAGLGGFDLPSRGYAARDSQQVMRLTETAVLSPSVINEARFQYTRRRANQTSSDNSPTIQVLDAFTGGGANIGLAFADEDRFELQNFTSFVLKNHSLKIGGRMRRIQITDASPNNFAGTYTFTNLDQYRSGILRTSGARPTQFSIAGGSPQASVKRFDVGIFAYAPGATGSNKPKTVFRGGFGVFYDRFSEGLTLQSIRFNGVNQINYLVSADDPDPVRRQLAINLLSQPIFTNQSVANSLTAAQVAAVFPGTSTIRLVAPNLQSPYTNQLAFSVERQLPYKTTLSATYTFAQTRRLLRSRNVNAPVGGTRPNPAAGNIFQYESTGRFTQNQLILNFRSNFSERVSIFGNYAFGGAKSDSDGAGTFPADQYDLTGEYGDSLVDIRHRFVLGGNLAAPLGIRLSPFVTFRSGIPFNITTGTDTNGDTLFNDRPAFATDLNRQCNFGTPDNPSIRSCVVQTQFGNFDLQPVAGQTIIPRNYGRGPEFFIVNLTLAKEFGFGGKKKSSGQVQGSGDNNNRTGTNSPFGAGGGQRNNSGDEDESPYKLEFSVQIRNLFNRTNGGTPVGNLRSSFFGDPVSLASGFGFGGGRQSGGNRRIRFEVQFSF